MAEKNTQKYSNVIDLVMRSYNNRYHRMIQMTPQQAEKPENYASVRLAQEITKYSKVKKKQPIYKVGDKVRISISKDLFHRGYYMYFKEEIFKIKSVSNRLPITLYEIQTLDGKETLLGGWYSSELTLVKKNA